MPAAIRSPSASQPRNCFGRGRVPVRGGNRHRQRAGRQCRRTILANVVGRAAEGIGSRSYRGAGRRPPLAPQLVERGVLCRHGGHEVGRQRVRELSARERDDENRPFVGQGGLELRERGLVAEHDRRGRALRFAGKRIEHVGGLAGEVAEAPEHSTVWAESQVDELTLLVQDRDALPQLVDPPSPASRAPA